MKIRTTTFSQLRNNAKKFFDQVENGEQIEVYRHGKPIALITPVRPQHTTRWKQSSPVSIEGVSLSELILSERKSSR